MRHRYLCSGLFLLSLMTFFGCKTNINHINNNISCPIEFTFNAQYEKTWLATITALMAIGTVDALDQKSGFISTHIAPIDGNETQSSEQGLWDETYKFTYNIMLSPEGEGTRIVTRVQLYRDQLMGVSRVEVQKDQVTNYLREKLYKEISKKLFQGGTGLCSQGIFIQPIVTIPAKSETPVPEPLPPPPKPKPIFDAKIQAAQKALIDAGYTPGSTDGFMGKKTREALKAYQQDNSITVSGKLDKPTYELLTSLDWSSTPRLESKLVQDQIATAVVPEPSVVVQPKSPLTPSLASPTEKKPSGNFVTKDISYLLKSADVYGSDILDSIPAQTSLHVVSRNGEYFQIKYKGREGYIYSDSVKEL